jgi:hypothetical protein
MATAKAVEIGAATINETFTASALKLAELAGVSFTVTEPLWLSLSAKFASGAGAATVLVGRTLSAGSALMEQELPVLREIGVIPNFIFLP